MKECFWPEVLQRVYPKKIAVIFTKSLTWRLKNQRHMGKIDDKSLRNIEYDSHITISIPARFAIVQISGI